jgi:S-adenosylmethionine decarboxylase
MHFGEHLMIDGYGGEYKLLNDKETVLRTLDELPKRLGMRILAPPQVFFAKGNDKKDPGGWSGYVIIMESHVSIHTFPARGFVSADVYTCQNGLDIPMVEKILAENFQLKEVEKNFVRRGTRYPENDLY